MSTDHFKRQYCFGDLLRYSDPDPYHPNTDEQ